MAKLTPLQPAFVLHSKPFRNTSLWLDLFTLDQGRVHAIARGGRRSRASGKILLQPFTPLLVECVGKNDLLTLRRIEAQTQAYRLYANCLISGLYLNELLRCLLIRFDPHAKLFQNYSDTLVQMTDVTRLEPALRLFEKNLLRETGYGLHLTHEAKTHKAIEPDRYYLYYAEEGLSPCLSAHESGAFLGQDLMAIEANQFTGASVLSAAKRLLRIALTQRLGGKELHSRKMFL
ncbi:MAG: DNA repair protein RecO [Gammaproteobacteria bacterium]